MLFRSVHDIEASTELSPFKICPEIAGGVKKLVGERVVGGWTRTVQEKLGGVAGCTQTSRQAGRVITHPSHRRRELGGNKAHSHGRKGTG